MRRFPLFLLCLLASLCHGRTSGPSPETEKGKTTLTDPMAVLNPEAFPHEAWAISLKKGDSSGAIREFVRKLRSGPPRYDIEQSVPRLARRWLGVRLGFIEGANLDADLVVDKDYIGVYGIRHRFDGEMDWFFNAKTPGKPSTQEWQIQLGRHYQWLSLSDAYEKTGDKKYANAWEKELRSWLGQCPRPAGDGKTLPSAWRTIDTGIRSGWTWPYAFEVFRKSPHVSDEAIWLLVCGLREHALHLESHSGSHNWLVMETNGLGHVALMFPELRGASGFYDLATKRSLQILGSQFYPDGSHFELAPAYGAGTGVMQLYAFLNLARRTGRDVNPDTWDRLGKTASALFKIADPEGHCPPLNDSGPISVAGMFDEFAKVMPDQFRDRPWEKLTSELLPWGGYAVFRRPGRFALLDAGPAGASTHAHDDALQFIAYADGRWLLVDPGKPRYDGSAVTGHMKSSRGHNVVLCDGKKHREAKASTRQMVTEPFPIAFGEKGGLLFAAAKRSLSTLIDKNGDGREKGGLTSFEHERVIVDIPQLGWLVVDRLTPNDSDQHEWEWLWHLGSDQAEMQGPKDLIAVTSGSMVLKAGFAGTAAIAGTVLNGQKVPHLRGWSVDETANPRPLPVLQVKSAPISGSIVIATLFEPRGASAATSHSNLSVREEPGAILVTIESSSETRHLHFFGEKEFQKFRYFLDPESVELELPPH